MSDKTELFIGENIRREMKNNKITTGKYHDSYYRICSVLTNSNIKLSV